MRVSYKRFTCRFILAALVALSFGLASEVADAKGKLFKKTWVITVTAPDALSGYSFGVRTFTIKARKHTEPPSPLSVKKLTATTDDGTTVQGVWRQQGKNFSLTFEMPCNESEPCATIVLRGRMTSNTEMSGQTILIMDVRDRDNAAGFDTVNGSFHGFRQ
jgi:hypothetical protein